nr:MAG TPA: hypothetical protein [Caudoviricetes sp.]
MFEIPSNIILSGRAKINILSEHLFCYFVAMFLPSIK